MSAALVAWALAVLLSSSPVPAEQLDPTTRLVLGWAVMVEGGNDVDRAAVLYTLARRWRLQRRGWSFREQVERYVRPIWVGPQDDRQERILALSWATLPADVRDHVERWAAGLVADPCPDAVHWGASDTPAPARLRTCRGAANVFTRSHR